MRGLSTTDLEALLGASEQCREWAEDHSFSSFQLCLVLKLSSCLPFDFSQVVQELINERSGRDHEAGAPLGVGGHEYSYAWQDSLEM